ncbi:hypothetical protein [Cryptosporidium parvum Iowa II]|uniref:Uncharacterized protein n=2 Tax=Cryptosporidium parvum TaxID=5807 RepID=Q5CUR6_CRYPI|nr:hypothetical protein [Cryptosporidium parvum Iowa II]EAK89118.1 conserved hypothetical protein [Cryptosporidium parvum Iowa II]QOY42525.1 Uncharacterized protein CPATCC_0032720 [Cryptosporidium parvum]WKS76918.1 hypothetical protein CPCDC_3g1760 [Cryptosporidium sp. 43IA8]WRK31410.1 Uncharacterized protein cpbgf_3001760 [Cryptosporidium parvum]|eukprot:QOY42525.1 hypothetical protein CPATCC_001172 [Cryptosporidium parvum]
MASFNYIFTVGFVLISIYLNASNDAIRNEKIKSNEFSFLNAQGPSYSLSEHPSPFKTTIGPILFAGKPEGVSLEEYLSRFGYNGRKDDLQPACTKQQVKALLKELKKILRDYYPLVGKNNYFRKLSYTAAQNSLEDIDITRYLSSTRPLFTRTESILISLLERLFKCILSRKIKKYSKSSGYEVSLLLYNKSMRTISKDLLKVLKSVESSLGEEYPKCLRTSTGASLVECKALGESLDVCKEHIRHQKEAKEGKYKEEKVLKGILKSPHSDHSRSRPTSGQKHVKFEELASVDV